MQADGWPRSGPRQSLDRERRGHGREGGAAGIWGDPGFCPVPYSTQDGPRQVSQGLGQVEAPGPTA